MNRHVNVIAGRLSLRPPQRRSLEILDRVTEIVPPKKGADVQAALETIRSEFPSVTDFEREFPSLCFALAINFNNCPACVVSRAITSRKGLPSTCR